ncbi:hypothetical protein SE16_02065 [Ardenticatena maritima]|uniref:Secreted protein n=1 Tax=Ardenticatena maritima TaxID=872965 RepID=A0A0P6YYL4_9CHLR|nr:hypothetical protein SE16_02065 [Ardenticatena maritima]
MRCAGAAAPFLPTAASPASAGTTPWGSTFTTPATTTPPSVASSSPTPSSPGRRPSGAEAVRWARSRAPQRFRRGCPRALGWWLFSSGVLSTHNKPPGKRQKMGRGWFGWRVVAKRLFSPHVGVC